MTKILSHISRICLIAGLSFLMLHVATFPALAQIDLNLTGLGIELPTGGAGGDASTKIGNIIVAGINLLLAFSAIIAVGAIIWGGVKISLAAGNEHNAEQGKKIVLYAIIGLIVTGLSFFIINLIRTTLLTK